PAARAVSVAATGFFFCASAAGALHFCFDCSSLRATRGEAMKTVKNTATLKRKGDWKIMASATQNLWMLRRYSGSSLTLLRSKGPVGAHSSADHVGGFNSEMINAVGH